MPINKELLRKDMPFLLPDLPTCEQIIPYLMAIDRNRWYSNFGPLQHDFEHQLNLRFFPEIPIGDERVVACSSGTAAIELALLSLRLPRNARVLLPSFTFAATATAVIRAGYCPVFTDVDPVSWSLTPDIALRVLDYLTVDAVVPVAALGMPLDVSEWDAFSKDKGIPVIIDAAAALGEQRAGKEVIVCFSMHATKNFGIGEGGLIVTPCANRAGHIRRLSNFGFDNGEIVTAGSNYKLSEYHAAVGMAQLQRLDDLARKKERVRAAYRKHLAALKTDFSVQEIEFDKWHSEPGVVSLNPPRFSSAVALRLESPQIGTILPDVIAKLHKEGVGVRRWYSPVLHLHPAFRGYETINCSGQRDLPVTMNLNSSLIGLPFHNFLSEPEVGFVCQRLESALRSAARKNKKNAGMIESK